VREETDSIAEAGIAQTFFKPKIGIARKKKEKKDGFCQNLNPWLVDQTLTLPLPFSLLSSNAPDTLVLLTTLAALTHKLYIFRNAKIFINYFFSNF
jgi:hypothetical protein